MSKIRGWSALVLLAWMYTALVFAAQVDPGPRIEVRFSPRGGCTDLIVRHVDAARHTLYVSGYQWSSPEIHAAVVRAKARGVVVRIILDTGLEGAQYTLLADLLAAGFTSDSLPDDTMRIDDRHKIMHNKYIVADPEYPKLAAVETGSFNFSKAAETANAENALRVVDADLAKAYLADWKEHWGHSRGIVQEGR
jgi:phosphatidylserine/phosphatidylglycerophosphate/cardiolipin synthase-like enzyme